jgi:hypothetical protein
MIRGVSHPPGGREWNRIKNMVVPRPCLAVRRTHPGAHRAPDSPAADAFAQALEKHHGENDAGQSRLYHGSPQKTPSDSAVPDSLWRAHAPDQSRSSSRTNRSSRVRSDRLTNPTSFLLRVGSQHPGDLLHCAQRRSDVGIAKAPAREEDDCSLRATDRLLRSGTGQDTRAPRAARLGFSHVVAEHAGAGRELSRHRHGRARHRASRPNLISSTRWTRGPTSSRSSSD